MRRILIVFDGAAWFVRRVRAIEHNVDRGEKVYYCDEHLAGPFDSVTAAAHFVSGLGWTS